MSEPDGKTEKCRILALLWHAPHQFIAAGGFRRTYEIFARTPAGIEILAVDDRPTFLSGMQKENVQVIEYGIPGPVRRLEERFFWFERVLEWILATLIMCFRCVSMRARGERFDVVFVPSSEQLPALLAGIVARFLFRARLVACNLNIDIFPAIARKPIARLHNAANLVIAISEHLRGELESYGVRSPMVVNSVGLDTASISRVPDTGPEEKVFDAVFVGRHDLEKGVFDLVEIWKSVTRMLPAARLVMIGSCNPGNSARLSSLLAKYGLDDRVSLMGIVGDEEKYSLIKRSKICLFPSYVEEWGLVPQEALACGLPAVVYDLPVYQENIAACEAVFRLPVGDTEGMARKAAELLAGEKYLDCEQIGPRCVQEFSWDEVAAREFDILTEGQPRR